MALQFHPNPGTILMCDFSHGFTEPEMVKKRPVLVISPKMKKCSGLCTVVAISTVKPEPIENWHYQLPKTSMPRARLFQQKNSWVKGDMIYRVGFHRLDLIKLDRESGSNLREYFKQSLGREQMAAVYACVLHSLNLSHLQKYI